MLYIYLYYCGTVITNGTWSWVYYQFVSSEQIILPLQWIFSTHKLGITKFEDFGYKAFHKSELLFIIITIIWSLWKFQKQSKHLEDVLEHLEDVFYEVYHKSLEWKMFLIKLYNMHKTSAGIWF